MYKFVQLRIYPGDGGEGILLSKLFRSCSKDCITCEALALSFVFIGQNCLSLAWTLYKSHWLYILRFSVELTPIY